MFNRNRHERAIKQAYQCYDDTDYEGASTLFEKACKLQPDSWEAHFGLGVANKFLCHWLACLEASQRAAQLRPNFEGSWWNVGIAATALGRWRDAREGWARAGVKMEINDKPVEMQLGRVPIRLVTTNSEVVWCRRIDPARAIILNVPTGDSLHRYGDLLLHDGEPCGSRLDHGVEVPVFNALQIIQASQFGTFELTVEHATDLELEELLKMESDDLRIEDWSTNIRYLCRKCSEGSPHDHHDDELRDCSALNSTRRIGFAANNIELVRYVLSSWAVPATVQVGEIECLVEPKSTPN